MFWSCRVLPGLSAATAVSLACYCYCTHGVRNLSSARPEPAASSSSAEHEASVHTEGSSGAQQPRWRTAVATLTTNDAYMVGVVALYRSLRRVGALSAERPLLVMVTAEVTDSAKKQLQLAGITFGQSNAADGGDAALVSSNLAEGGVCGFIEIVMVDALGNPAAEQGERAKKRFDSVYTKLNVFIFCVKGSL